MVKLRSVTSMPPVIWTQPASPWLMSSTVSTALPFDGDARGVLHAALWIDNNGRWAGTRCGSLGAARSIAACRVASSQWRRIASPAVRVGALRSVIVFFSIFSTTVTSWQRLAKATV